MVPLRTLSDALGRLATTPFLGRAPLLEAARSALAGARDGRGHSILLFGEAGIGKTRLADELIGIARSEGFRPVPVRCHDLEGAPALWPWLQIARSLLAGLDRHERSRWLEGEGRAVARLLSDFAFDVSSGPVNRASDEATVDRYVLFEALTALVRRASGAMPLLLVIDDLHWADPASVLLARYAVRELRRDPVVFLGLYRDTDVPPGDPLDNALADLSRESEVYRLGGLEESDVRRLVEHVAGVPASNAQSSELLLQTGGNPFFLVEILRLLASEDRLDGGAERNETPGRVPLTVRHVLEQRLARLAPATVSLLQQASVLGREVDVEILEAAMAGSEPNASAASGHPQSLGSALDEAIDSRLLQPVPGDVGRLRFAHDLIRETLSASLGTDLRIAFHRRAGDAIVQTRSGALDEHSASLALHYLESAGAGTARAAIEFAVRGAERAAERFSFELAVALFRRGLRALDFLAARETPGRAEQTRRGEILLRLGDVLWQAGQRKDAEEAHRAAVTHARSLGDFELLAEAAIGLSGRDDMSMQLSVDRVELLKEALAGLARDDSRLRVRLLTHLVRATYFGEDRERLFTWAGEAGAIAGRLGDPLTRFAALESLHYAQLMPRHLVERLEVSAQFPALARQAGSLRFEALAWLWRIYDLVQVPDIAAADRALARFAEIADRLRQPFYEWLVLGLQAARAQMEGDLERTEQLVFKALETGQRAATPNAILIFGTQLFHLRAEQGRVDELLPVMQKIVEGHHALPVFRIGIPLIHALANREAEARRTFEEVAARDFEDVPRDLHRLPMLTSAAAVCAYLGDTRRARRLHRELLEDSGHIMIGGIMSHWGGPVDRALGQLEEALGQLDAAADHFERAARVSAVAGARLLEAHASTEHARVLRERNEPGDAARAAELEAHANALYRARGISGPPALPIPLRSQRSTPVAWLPPAPAAVGPAPPCVSDAEARFVRTDREWQIEFEGGTIALADTKGLAYLQRLLAQPGVFVHVLDLVALEAPASSSVQAEHPGSAGGRARLVSDTATNPARLVEGAVEVLDAAARRAYQARLDELVRLQSEASRDRDLARLDSIRREREMLERELLAAYGHGGRTRAANDPVERARKSVYNRIRDAIRRIESSHPALSRHLASAVRTGTVCVYRPEVERTWQV